MKKIIASQQKYQYQQLVKSIKQNKMNLFYRLLSDVYGLTKDEWAAISKYIKTKSLAELLDILKDNQKTKIRTLEEVSKVETNHITKKHKTEPVKKEIDLSRKRIKSFGGAC